MYIFIGQAPTGRYYQRMWKKRERCLLFYVVIKSGFVPEKGDTAICQTIRKSRKPQEGDRSGVRSEPSAGRDVC
jgi:hypothetical protein